MNTPPPPYIEATWQVRCLRFDGTPMTMGCTQPPERSIFGYNGTDQQRLTCNIRESGAVRTINFSASARGMTDGVTFSIALANASIPVGGGTPSGSCMFTFADGNVYSAPCGGLMPSPAQPCQVQNITFGTFEMSSTTRIEVYCIEAPGTVDSTQHRGITQAGSGSNQEMDPFVITLYDCPVTR